MLTLSGVVLRNARWVVPLTLLQSSLYAHLCTHPPSPPLHLPKLELDEALPFWPWTIWPYLGFLLLSPGLALLIRSPAVVRRAQLAYLIMMCFTLIFWVFLPTTIVRPILKPDGSWTAWLYNLTVETDGYACCFPSGHIFLPTIDCWALVSEGWNRWLLYGGLLLLSLTIVTTRSHYCWDILGGYMVAVLGILISGWVKSGR
ncbi:phosphatase PAP2 family protein [bacterium]|nr:phosphatase PAP2 family protein [bacterium]